MKENEKYGSRILGDGPDSYVEYLAYHLKEIGEINFKYVQVNEINNSLCINLYNHLLLSIIENHIEELTESEMNNFIDVLSSNLNKNLEIIKKARSGSDK